MRYLTAGESHGEALIGIIEGLPSGLEVDIKYIDDLLEMRQRALGRGERMNKTTDRVKILSGLNGNFTTGAPIAVMIDNGNCATKDFDFFRPGHVDYAASIKYDLAPSVGAERASARETAMRTALGAIALQLLEKLGVFIDCEAVSVGGSRDFEAALSRAEESSDTVGGRAKLTVRGVAVGIGSCSFFDRRLDAILGGALFSVPAVKAVENGLGVGFESAMGREVADEFTVEGGKIKRKSNNCGGIEGGISNGEGIVFFLTFKPVPSVKGLETIDGSGEPTVTDRVRGDVCAVFAGCIAAKATAALALTGAILDCLGGDTMEELIERYDKKARKGICKK